MQLLQLPGNPTKSYRSTEPFKIVGVVSNWQEHPPEQIKAMKDTLAKLKEQGVNSLNDQNRTMNKSNLIEMNNIGIVVENLDNAILFFSEIGLKVEGRSRIEGEWAGRVTGLGNQSVEMVMMVTPDSHSRLEISKFLVPSTVSDHRTTPVNSLGYLRIMFRVDNLDELLTRLLKLGAELVGEVVNYEDIYRLCYIRGTEGLLIGLAEQLGNQTTKDILENT